MSAPTHDERMTIEAAVLAAPDVVEPGSIADLKAQVEMLSSALWGAGTAAHYLQGKREELQAQVDALQAEVAELRAQVREWEADGALVADILRNTHPSPTPLQFVGSS